MWKIVNFASSCYSTVTGFNTFKWILQRQSHETRKALISKRPVQNFFFFLACHNFVFWFSKLTCAVCVHCPKNNHNLGIKVTPVTVGADAAGYLCLVSVSDILYCTVYICVQKPHIYRCICFIRGMLSIQIIFLGQCSNSTICTHLRY